MYRLSTNRSEEERKYGYCHIIFPVQDGASRLLFNYYLCLFQMMKALAHSACFTVPILRSSILQREKKSQ